MTLLPSVLTFTSDWTTPKTVSVSGVDDSTIEPFHTSTITHSATGGSYDGVSIADVIVNITDAPASVTITESGGSTGVAEGGSGDSYSIVLDAKPTSTVVVTATPDSQVTLSTSTLVFSVTNWDTIQNTTVTAVDDAVPEGAHTSTITHSASGGGYSGASISSVVANITDNDTPSVTVTETGGSTDVTEGGGADNYDIVLDLEPSGTVTVTVTPDSDVSLNTTTLTFLTGNWSTPQTVSVTAVNDAVVEGAHTSTITHSATGGGYGGVSISNVVANITDNDTPSVTVTETGGSTDVTEGGAADNYDVVLDLEPSGTVTVTVTPDSEVTLNTTTLTFLTSNWSTPQTVSVTAVNDAVVEDAHTSTITHSASGGSYDSVSINNVVANVTDAPATVTITESGGSTDVTEGGATDTYDVVLDAKPTSTVTIVMSSDLQVTTTPAALNFTTVDWSTPQTVTVTAIDDSSFEGTHAGTITHSASGGGYDGASIGNVVATVTDNDSGSIVLVQTDYRWYQNLDGAQPTTALAAENASTIDVESGAILHLRMNLANDPGPFNAGTVFKLQYGTSTAGPWTDVGTLGSGSIWRGYDNSTPVDGSALSAELLTSSDSSDTQSYEESNPSAANSRIGSNRTAEWGWVLEDNSADTNTAYYYRMLRDDGEALAGYTNYPTLTTKPFVGLTFTPNNSDSGAPETIVSYSHTVTNNGDLADTFDITATSSEGWTLALYESDGVTPLVDSDADTIPDTGAIAPSASASIVVKVTVGWSSTSDIVTVRATSSADPLVFSTSTDSTTAPPTITVTLDDSTMSFSGADPDCESNPDGSSVGEFTVYHGTIGNQGCTYIWNDLTVTVKSNAPWTGTVAGTDQSPTSDITVALSSFRYDTTLAVASYSDCSSATTLSTSTSPFESAGTGGINPYTFRHCVLINWNDRQGTIDSALEYAVTQ